MEFVKVHGAGNDFVLLPDLHDRIELGPGLVRALCTPHTGLGADGVIRVGAPRRDVAADAFMDYRNADGSIAETCGNGIRCVAKYLVDHGHARPPVVLVDTRAGVMPVTVTQRDDGLVTAVRVDMGVPVPGKVGLVLEGVEVTTLSMGNPHAVVVVDDVAAAPVAELGGRIAANAEFPDGTNVEFIAVPARDRVEGRILERGVGETLASGSGAAAMAVAASLLGLADRSVTVVLPGGELHVDWLEESVFVTGPACEVARGQLGDGWLAAVTA